jgi:retron-type reverse transcriptase
MRRIAEIGVTPRTQRILHIFLYCSNFSVDGRNVHKIEKGCPQGSIISPILFIIYFGTLIERLKTIVPSEGIGAFADDLVVRAEGLEQLETLV